MRGMPSTWTASPLSRHRGGGGPFCIGSRDARELDGAGGEEVSISWCDFRYHCADLLSSLMFDLKSVNNRPVQATS